MKALRELITMFLQTGVGKDVTSKAKENLRTWKRPWWLSRRFVGAAILIISTVTGNFTGLAIAEEQVAQWVQLLDNVIPYLQAYGAALGVFGFTNREKAQ